MIFLSNSCPHFTIKIVFSGTRYGDSALRTFDLNNFIIDIGATSVFMSINHLLKTIFIPVKNMLFKDPMEVWQICRRCKYTTKRIILCNTIWIYRITLVCAFSCTFKYSRCHGMDKGTCDIVHWSAAPHNRIANRTGFWVYVVLVLNVIRYSSHYFLDNIIFHPNFHNDSCDYHWDFLWPFITFWSIL